MKIALVAPPFIAVPPKKYGGTELFIAQLASGLKQQGAEVVVYANGESSPNAELRSLYSRSEWPLATDDIYKDLNHCAWAVHDAAPECDIIHLNSAPSLVLQRFVRKPFVYTIHHAFEMRLRDFYNYYPEVHYVSISDFQRRQNALPRCTTIYHGIDPAKYTVTAGKQPYLSFLGRIAPVKGTDIAIEVARRSGIPLKIAGEVQPMYRDYYESVIKPKIDGKFIEYVGEADLASKNELLGNSMALIFPIQWDEPFGLVMVEAMACGTPVLGFPRGSVPEVIKDGVSGFFCADADDMVTRLRSLALDAAAIRAYVEASFSVDRMAREYARLYSDILDFRAGAPARPLGTAANDSNAEDSAA